MRSLLLLILLCFLTVALTKKSKTQKAEESLIPEQARLAESDEDADFAQVRSHAERSVRPGAEHALPARGMSADKAKPKGGPDDLSTPNSHVAVSIVNGEEVEPVASSGAVLAPVSVKQAEMEHHTSSDDDPSLRVKHKHHGHHREEESKAEDGPHKHHKHHKHRKHHESPSVVGTTPAAAVASLATPAVSAAVAPLGLALPAGAPAPALPVGGVPPAPALPAGGVPPAPALPAGGAPPAPAPASAPSSAVPAVLPAPTPAAAAAAAQAALALAIPTPADAASAALAAALASPTPTRVQVLPVAANALSSQPPSVVGATPAAPEPAPPTLYASATAPPAAEWQTASLALYQQQQPQPQPQPQPSGSLARTDIAVATTPVSEAALLRLRNPHDPTVAAAQAARAAEEFAGATSRFAESPLHRGLFAATAAIAASSAGRPVPEQPSPYATMAPRTLDGVAAAMAAAARGVDLTVPPGAPAAGDTSSHAEFSTRSSPNFFLPPAGTALLPAGPYSPSAALPLAAVPLLPVAPAVTPTTAAVQPVAAPNLLQPTAVSVPVLAMPQPPVSPVTESGTVLPVASAAPAAAAAAPAPSSPTYAAAAAAPSSTPSAAPAVVPIVVPGTLASTMPAPAAAQLAEAAPKEFVYHHSHGGSLPPSWARKIPPWTNSLVPHRAETGGNEEASQMARHRSLPQLPVPRIPGRPLTNAPTIHPNQAVLSRSEVGRRPASGRR